MPWKECSAMDERLQLVARRRAGDLANLKFIDSQTNHSCLRFFGLFS